MKKLAVFLTIIFGTVFTGFYLLKNMNGGVEAAYQHDADLLRLEHLVYWTGLLEEYQAKTGHYPFQNSLSSDEQPGMVRVATKDQQLYYTPVSEKYRQDLNNNENGSFQEFTVLNFVHELETGLDRTIEEKYDIQKVPGYSPVGYYYFVTNKGYLFWVTCITCGVTEISTLLMDGFTPTVNIVSSGMKGDVTKALTREEMINHPIFKDWKNQGFHRENAVRFMEGQTLHDSKTE